MSNTDRWYIEAPTDWRAARPPYAGLFLAGGITGCPDWQQEIRALLTTKDVVVLNPRRANFPIADPRAARAQITWEHRHLRRATAILFWFPAESLCPIALYELGAWSMTDKPLFVGCDLAYARRTDVIEQTALARPDVIVVHALTALAEQVRRWGWGGVR